MSVEPKSFKSYFTPLRTNCCMEGAGDKFNLYAANPFDARVLKYQTNRWCSNELILKDKSLRCRAKVQPLDIGLDKSVSKNLRPY
jgi:hypothetical protein